MTSPPPPAPGWYPDPSGRGNRYWDGTSWGPTAPTAPQRRKGGGVPAWLIVIGVLFLTCGGCGVLGLIGVLSSDDSKTDNHSTTRAAPAFTTGPTVAAPAPTEEPTPGIGQEVRDGKFAFTVTSVDRSQVAGDPSNPFLQTHAKAEFVNVHLTVANIGNEPQTYFASNRKLLVGGQE